jgi:hypothetical protein
MLRLRGGPSAVLKLLKPLGPHPRLL